MKKLHIGSIWKANNFNQPRPGREKQQDMELNKIYNESNLETMARMPDNFLHCVVTSPPYWGLRDYGTDGTPWPAVTYRPLPGMPEVYIPEQVAQLGLEETPEAFVGHIVHIFREVRRVLREDGTLWLNFGDTYAAYKANTGDTNYAGFSGRPEHKTGWQYGSLKPKDLCGIPWRVAFALQADGWWLRQDIIWAKPNPMPESVTDRCTKAHEYVFLLTKSSRYYYDAEAVKQPVAPSTEGRGKVDFGGAKGREYTPDKADPNYRNGSEQWGRTFDYKESCKTGRNRRSVWTIATQPYSGAHFAVFPPALVKPCILAGSPQKVCSKCGAGWVREVERKTSTNGRTPHYTNASGRNDGGGKRGGGFEDHSTKTLGWLPACTCNAEPGRAIVYDPFGGSGTTAEVANEYGRDWIVSEISEEYVRECTRPRLEKTKQKTLF